MLGVFETVLHIWSLWCTSFLVINQSLKQQSGVSGTASPTYKVHGEPFVMCFLMTLMKARSHNASCFSHKCCCSFFNLCYKSVTDLVHWLHRRWLPWQNQGDLKPLTPLWWTRSLLSTCGTEYWRRVVEPTDSQIFDCNYYQIIKSLDFQWFYEEIIKVS